MAKKERIAGKRERILGEKEKILKKRERIVVKKERIRIFEVIFFWFMNETKQPGECLAVLFWGNGAYIYEK